MRKRILFCLAALLFTAGAFAQKPWDAAVPANSGSDTLFICMPYGKPLKLGEDVLKHYLPQTKGDWTMIYPSTSHPSYPGKEVFLVDGAQPGTYIFQYEVTETMCSVAVGDKFLAYVVIVPDMQSVEKVVDVCLNADASLASATAIQAALPSEVNDFITYWWSSPLGSVTYNPTSITLNSTTPATAADNTSTTGTKVNYVDVTLTPISYPAGKYTCDLAFKLKYTVNVNNNLLVNPAVDTLMACQDDLAVWTRKLPSEYFGISIAGTWSANPSTSLDTPGDDKINFNTMTTGNGHGAGGVGPGPYHTFTFAYMDCDGVTSLTATRVIEVLANNQNANLGNDFGHTFCKQLPYDSINLNALYNGGMLLPYASGITWKYLGNKPDGSGTIAPSPMADGTLENIYTADYYVKKALIQTGQPYYFRFKFGSSISCMAGDSGMVEVTGKLPTGSTFENNRVQICRKDQLDFNMNAYLSLSAATVWSNIAPNPGPNVSAGTFLSADQLLDLYSFGYDEPAVSGACGGARKGDIAVKVTDHLVYSEDNYIYYCLDILPTFTNLFDIIGIAPVPGTWTTIPAGVTMTSAGHQVTLAELAVQYDPSNPTYTFEFTPTAGSGAGASNCVQNPIRVHITLGTVLPQQP